jgi:hypothetical protein
MRVDRETAGQDLDPVDPEVERRAGGIHHPASRVDNLRPDTVTGDRHDAIAAHEATLNRRAAVRAPRSEAELRDAIRPRIPTPSPGIVATR